ncbi:transposase [Rickettsia endosymbiont of Oedothorax gibbosus]|uniref:transposase n=1 Tax=Rickettsia endosymbiont of Oedothorax gibbosus TaxID=931099 RepID=UPI00202437FE|nr:transposase [Rickettsia endosymbiont of Oedothorax gibbosus]
MHSKKHLSFSAIRSMIADKFAGIEDRRGVNSSNSIADIMLSGLACMYFQSVSLLEFQRRMERKEQRNNLRSMFTVQSLPSDQGMRNVIDQVDSDVTFRPIFKELFSKLQRGKHLEQYQIFPGKYLLNVDGTQYYSSDKVSCKRCLIRGHKNNQYHCHQVLQGAIVKFGLRQVIPVMPEEIRVQDGDEKEDCETNAFKRFLTRFRKDHDKLGIIINADALYATTPVIETIRDHKANYIFKVKPNNHKTLMDNVQSVDKSKIETLSLRRNKLIIEWVNDVELFTSTKVRTNYIAAWELVPQKDGSNKSQYYGKWITDLEITSDNAKTIIDGARARWKIENECFNSLKNHGYNIEHNYGHGSENLCYNFYNFTLLAFTIHQIHQLVDKLFQEMREQFGRLGSLWERIRSLVDLFFFESMEMLWEILAGKRDYRVPPI